MQGYDRKTIIEINGKEYIIPETWNDLKNQHIMKAYLVLLNQRLDSVFEADEALEIRRQELMKIILEIDDDFIDVWKKDAGEDFYYELQVVSHATTGFAFEPVNEDGAVQIKLDLTRNPFPILPFKGEPYWGPADGLNNITLYELGKSFLAFEAFMESGADEDAAELIAILFRPGKPSTPENIRSGFEGDRRLPIYNHESTLAPRAEVFQRHLPLVVRQVIIFWFASCRMAIVKSFPNLFDGNNQHSENDGNDYSWAGIILNLAGGLVNEESVSNKNWGTAFTYLSMLEDQRKEAELKALLNSKV